MTHEQRRRMAEYLRPQFIQQLWSAMLLRLSYLLDRLAQKQYDYASHGSDRRRK